MLDILFVIMNILAILLFYMGIEYESEHVYWNIIMTFLAWVFFLFLTGTSTMIEIPYSVYNATSGVVESGYHIYYTGMLMYVYFALFISSFMYFLDLILHKHLVAVVNKYKSRG